MVDAPKIRLQRPNHRWAAFFCSQLRSLCGLVPIGVEGAIIGTALYVGNFTLPDALAVARDPRARVDA